MTIITTMAMKMGAVNTGILPTFVLLLLRLQYKSTSGNLRRFL